MASISKTLFWGYPKEDIGIGISLCACMCARSCPTLWDSMDCSMLGSSVRGILQARILKWVAIPFSGGSSQPGNGTWISCIAGRFFTREAGDLNHIEFSYLLNGSHSF